MRLLATGGSGFALSHAVKAWLDADPRATAVVFDRKRAWEDPELQSFFGPAIRARRVALFDGDVSEREDWRRLREWHGEGFTHVICGAAITPTPEEERRPPRSRDGGGEWEPSGPLRLLEVNLFGAALCLEWALRLPHLHRLVYVGSDAVYSVPGLVRAAAEAELPAAPQGFDAAARHGSGSVPLYALTKFAGEALVERYRVLYRLDAVCVRFSDVYGPLDRDTGARNRHNAPYWVCQKAAEGRVVRVAKSHGGLDGVGWDYIDAPSAGRAIVAVLRSAREPKRPVYHIALGRAVPHRELLEAAGAAAQTVPASLGDRNDGGPVDLRGLPPGHWLRRRSFDPGPLKEEFGWEPAELGDAMQEYTDYLQARLPLRERTQPAVVEEKQLRMALRAERDAARGGQRARL